MLKKGVSIILVMVMIVSIFTIIPFSALAESLDSNRLSTSSAPEGVTSFSSEVTEEDRTDNNEVISETVLTEETLCSDTSAKDTAPVIISQKTELASTGTVDKANVLSDNLFHNAIYYNNDLATVCANLCCDVDNVSEYFPENHSAQYTWGLLGQAFHVGIGYTTIHTNGSPKTLISISFRGTGSIGEAILDFIKDYEHNSYEGQQALVASYDFAVSAEYYLNQFIDEFPDVKKHPIVYLVSGYSIGGAGANLLGARLTNRNGGECSDNVFVYTFGAIKAIASSSNVQNGYRNIHNIYNYYDSWGPHGNHSIYGVSDPYYKFGNTHFCYFDRDHTAFTLNSHDMGNYLTEVETKKVEVSINRKAGILNGGQWWTISNRNLNITDWDYLNIYGSGALSDGSLMGMDYPWYGYFDDINMIVLDDRITSIGEFEFSKADKFDNLYTIHIPKSVTSIGNFAFSGCDALGDVYYHGTHEQWDAINVDFSAGNYPLQNATLHCIDDEPLSTDNIDQNRVVIESGSCGPDLMYVLYADGILEITGSGEMTSHPWTAKSADSISHVVFPAELTSLCDSAFDNCIALREIEIPSSVKSIGNFAFRNSGLDSLILPEGVEKLGYHLLYGNTGIKDLTVPGSVTSFGYSTATYYSGANRGVFEYCGIERVIIKNGITSISPMMFTVCKTLKEVVIPESVETIGFEAFEGCIALENIMLPNSITEISYRAFKNSGLKSITLPSNIASIGSSFLAETEVKYLYIPKSFNNAGTYEGLGDKHSMLYGSSVETVGFENGIETIPENSLLGAASTTSVVLPSSVKEIGNFAFQNSGLISLSIPNGVEKLGYHLLYGNTGVKELTIPSSVTSFGYSTATYYSGADRGVFEYSGLERVTIENGITELSPMMFCYCKSLKEVVIPNTVTKIGFEAFEGCSALENISLLNSITEISYRAFKNSGLKNITLPSNIASIGSSFLADTEVKYLLIPKSFNNAGTYEGLGDKHSMLYGSSVETVEFENGIETIPENSLLGAASTTNVILPSSVKTIGNYAFQNSGLTSLTLPDGIETIGYCVLSGNKGVKELTIPGSVTNLNYNTYYYGGGTFQNSALEKVIIEDGVTTITPQAFLGCDSLNSISIPESVTSIGTDAFCRCTALESIDLPDSITRIEARAFQNTGLKELVLPDMIEFLGSGILIGNTEVTYLKIPKTLTYAESRYSSSDYGMLEGSAVATVEFEDGIETIPEKALFRASSTTDVIIPSSVKTIGNYAFQSSGLTSLTLPDGIETIGYCVLSGNKGVKELTIPGSVNNLNYNTYYYGGGTFQNSALEKVIIEDGITTITPQAFCYCSSLEEIKIPYSVNKIGDNAFNGCSELTISGYTNSYAYTYASDNSIPFISLGEYIVPTQPPTQEPSYTSMLLGDADGDGDITILDATIIQRYLAAFAIPKPEYVEKCGDVNGDGIDILDATFIQRYLAAFTVPYEIGKPI